MFNLIKKNIENFFPGYFAFVMATGALSIGTNLLGFALLPNILLYINIFAFILLWLITLIRIVFFLPKVLSDLTSHTLGPGFFTFIAGANVFGSQLIIIAENYTLAFFLWGLSLILWVIIMKKNILPMVYWNGMLKGTM